MTIISGRGSSDYSSGNDSNSTVLIASVMEPIAAAQEPTSTRSKHLSPQ